MWMGGHQGGVARRLKVALSWLPFRVYEIWRRIRRDSWVFEYEGERLHYLADSYNTTWLNERTVEVPIALKYVDPVLARGGLVLEVGNVLSHYGRSGHTVVDKYEVAPGVVNADIMEFDPPQKFDLVISISTIEHVGWDERPREPEKAIAAIERLRQFVAPGGELVVTIPPGYNEFLDQAVRDGRVVFGRRFAMRKRPRSLRWEPADPADLQCRPWQPVGGTGELLVGVDSL